jgi:3'-5' exoribonuclease
MKEFYVADAAQFDNKIVTTSFVVASKQVKPKKNGEPYLALTLSDRTGQIDAKMWDNVADAIDTFDQDDFVKVRGLINKYNSRFQLTLYKIRPAGESEVDFEDYLPKCPRDVDELWRTLCEFVAGFQDANLRGLIQSFINDPQISKAYRTAPAAKTLHHAYIGGLLDHVVSLFKLCDLAARNYPQIDRDLLLSGAFLHDIGKIHELTYARSFNYSNRGQLLGHMIIELEMLQAKLRELPGFPEDLKMLLEHMIISHHGHYEFGSPKLPMFPEALMLHYLDDLDSKMEAMRAQFERNAGLENPWAGYNNSLERPLLDAHKLLTTGAPNKREALVGVETGAPQKREAGVEPRTPQTYFGEKIAKAEAAKTSE